MKMKALEPETRCRAAAAARTLTTLVIAFASTVVMTLAGCASPAGIAPTASLADPAALGVGGAADGYGASRPAAGDPASTAADAVPLAADWWRSFADPALAALIERAVAGSPSLRVAEARLDRAAAGVAGARAARGPQVGGAVDASRQRFSENGLYPPPIAGSIRESATAQLSGSWEVDLFGRNRAALDAAIGSESAARADAAAARVLLAVDVARAYVQLGRAVEQREVLARSLGQRDELLGLIRQRVSAGLDTAAELRQSEVGPPETRSQIAVAEEQIALARHAIAALAALPPAAVEALAPRLSALRPVPLPDVVPADLLARRADIAAARWRVEAASGDVAAARAQFYPTIDLTAFVGLSSLGFDRLLRGGSEQWGAGPAIRLPILDSGRLRANLRGRTADLDAAVENYNGSVVDAVHDVADQIASSRAVDRQQREQAAALSAAEAAYAVATQRYRAGLATYLTVLNAETSVIAQRRGDVDARARRLDLQMLLVRALGGGYAAAPELAAAASN